MLYCQIYSHQISTGHCFFASEFYFIVASSSVIAMRLILSISQPERVRLMLWVKYRTMVISGWLLTSPPLLRPQPSLQMIDPNLLLPFDSLRLQQWLSLGYLSQWALSASFHLLSQDVLFHYILTPSPQDQSSGPSDFRFILSSRAQDRNLTDCFTENKGFLGLLQSKAACSAIVPLPQRKT